MIIIKVNLIFNIKIMITITIEKDTNLQKTKFVNLLDLYEYLEDYVWPDLQFTSYESMTESHKKEYDKSFHIDKSKLLNI